MTISSCAFTSSSMSLKERLCGGASISLRARHHRRGLGQPGGKPEALHFALHLVARAGAAVIAVEGRGLEEKRFHRIGRTSTSVRTETSRRSARPKGGRPANAPSRRTATPRKPQNSKDPAAATARRARHGCRKYQSMRYFRNSRAPSAVPRTARLAGRKSSKIAAISAKRERKCNDAAHMTRPD